MKLIVFNEWDLLVRRIRKIATGVAEEKAGYPITRIIPKSGRAVLSDRAVNLLSLEGGATTLVMPDVTPGKARDFLLRVTAGGENTLAFTGAEAFEGADDALAPPGDGETILYFFTETAAGVLFVTRRKVERIASE